MGRCLKERLQKEDKGGHIILETIIFSLRYKAGPQRALLNPQGGAKFAIDRRCKIGIKELFFKLSLRSYKPLYSSCTTGERKSSRAPETAVPVLKLYYQRTKIQPAAGDGRSSSEVVLPENENPAGHRRQPFQY